MACSKGCCATQGDHYRSVGLVGKNVGKPRVGITKDADTTVKTIEHWDGRVDATVTPDTVRFGARVHNTGKRKGEVAEVTKLDPKEKRQRYGDQS